MRIGAKIAIVHFQPLELYPPVINLLKYLVLKQPGNKVNVYSTGLYAGTDAFSQPPIKIYRFIHFNESRPRILRLMQYLWFYCRTLFSLLKHRPTEILYFESLSFLPVYIYWQLAKLTGKKPRIFCHYHEYMSIPEYKSGMFLHRLNNNLEKKVFADMCWISHTNKERMLMFKNDNETIVMRNTYVLPNYPPKAWGLHHPGKSVSPPLRIVCVGVMSLDTMYTREFANWVNSMNGEVIWDIYSFNMPTELNNYLKVTDNKYVNFKGPIKYEDIPAVLKNYQVGVILYRGHIPNVIHCAPNKLFEYLATGLDVWFPPAMLGIKEYARDKQIPKVLEVDFENMDKFDFKRAIDREHLTPANYEFYAENVLGGLVDKLIQQ